jgi:peptidylprolyl isomerase
VPKKAGSVGEVMFAKFTKPIWKGNVAGRTLYDAGISQLQVPEKWHINNPERSDCLWHPRTPDDGWVMIARVSGSDYSGPESLLRYLNYEVRLKRKLPGGHGEPLKVVTEYIADYTRDSRTLSDRLYGVQYYDQEGNYCNSIALIKVGLNSLRGVAKREAEAVAYEIAKSFAPNPRYLDGFQTHNSPSGLTWRQRGRLLGVSPKSGQYARIFYTIKLPDGTVVMKTESTPLEFQIGQGKVIKGLDEGVASLRIGEEATFLVPSSLA